MILCRTSSGVLTQNSGSKYSHLAHLLPRFAMRSILLKFVRIWWNRKRSKILSLHDVFSCYMSFKNFLLQEIRKDCAGLCYYEGTFPKIRRQLIMRALTPDIIQDFSSEPHACHVHIHLSPKMPRVVHVIHSISF